MSRNRKDAIELVDMNDGQSLDDDEDTLDNETKEEVKQNPKVKAKSKVASSPTITAPSPPVSIRAIEVVAEIIGTFMLVFVGTTCVSSAVTASAQFGLWQVAVVWGIGLTLAIYATADLSGAHLNPAVSFAFSLIRPRDFPLWKFCCFALAQFFGAFIAGLVNAMLWTPALKVFEARNNITRGMPGSERSAMVLCCYFPNPAMAAQVGTVSFQHAFGVEVMGTACLCMIIFALNDAGNSAIRKSHTPWQIGGCLAMLISIFASQTQGCFNPARDFGPRLVAVFYGWGAVALPGPNSGFILYLVAPMIGAPIGGLIASKILRLGYKVKVQASLV